MGKVLEKIAKQVVWKAPGEGPQLVTAVCVHGWVPGWQSGNPVRIAVSTGGAPDLHSPWAMESAKRTR